jgi:hypothetical protein
MTTTVTQSHPVDKHDKMKRYHDAILQAFEDGHEFTLEGGRTVTVRSDDAGSLTLPSGRIVVSDPFVDTGNSPFTTSVEPGDYSVHLALADEAVALVMIMFKEGGPTTWKRATPRHFSVDSATGCVMGFEMARFLRRKAVAGKYDRHYRLFEESLVETGWANLTPSASMEANVVVFRTWGGDGTFPFFFGYDAEGDVSCLVIDMLTELLAKDG